MVKLIPVNPGDIPTNREGRRGRTSYPLLKMFLESNVRCSKLDLTGLDKNPNYLRSVLFSYINSHKLPIKIFSAGGELYLLRLDMDEEGVVDPNWTSEEKATEGAGGLLRDMPPQAITPTEVTKRSKIEKGKITK